MFALFFTLAETPAVPIDTPDPDERNNFVIRCPDGWGYRTFEGNNGLIGVLWPKGTSFNLTDTAIFVFLQDNNEPFPEEPDNINLFDEKCPKAKFMFDKTRSDSDLTQSLGERYFSGRCGRTMVIMKERIENYNIIILAVSAKKYITKDQLYDLKEITRAYRREAEAYLRHQESGSIDEINDRDSDDGDEEEEDTRQNTDNGALPLYSEKK